MRGWVLDRCKFEAEFEFVFYPARYDMLFFSISPAQNTSIIDAIPLHKVSRCSPYGTDLSMLKASWLPATDNRANAHLQRDCAILEEPEHLNWWEKKYRWSSEFNHVVGIMVRQRNLVMTTDKKVKGFPCINFTGCMGFHGPVWSFRGFELCQSAEIFWPAHQCPPLVRSTRTTSSMCSRKPVLI